MQPYQLKMRLKSLHRWVEVLIDGLSGNVHFLGETEGKAMAKALAPLGVELLSLTAASRAGLVLRRGCAPVVRRYFGAPISKHADLYCREQFRAR